MTTNNSTSSFDTLTDYQLMLLQEMCGRNFDCSDESRELLDAFIRMDKALMERGFNLEPVELKTTGAHKAA